MLCVWGACCVCMLCVWGACCVCGVHVVCVGCMLCVWGACCVCGVHVVSACRVCWYQLCVVWSGVGLDLGFMGGARAVAGPGRPAPAHACVCVYLPVSRSLVVLVALMLPHSLLVRAGGPGGRFMRPAWLLATCAT
jgi:hypothetical protein